MKKRSKKRFMLIVLFILIALIFSYKQNNDITITRMKIVSSEIPENFNGYKILQISDLHSKVFGKNQKAIVKKIINEAPDAIFVTGDLIDSKNYDADVCIQLCSQIIQVAPIYFVTGNHEAWSNKFDEFEKQLKDVGVKILRNEGELINIEDSNILVLGVDDPDFQGNGNMETQIEKLLTSYGGYYSILLSHRPELLDLYSEKNIDLVFSGHAHGGQIRLPIIGGVVAPNQGWFPQYTSGIYHVNDTTMIVSRGLGNSIIPQRIFNRPELIVVTLTK